MNNAYKQKEFVRQKKSQISGKTKDVLILALLVFVVLLASWLLFSLDSGDTQTVYSDVEKRIGGMLSQMDGVGEACVTVCETEDGVQSVVVVCDGAKDLQVILSIREAVATALGLEEKNVKIYLKKE